LTPIYVPKPAVGWQVLWLKQLFLARTESAGLVSERHSLAYSRPKLPTLRMCAV